VAIPGTTNWQLTLPDGEIYLPSPSAGLTKFYFLSFAAGKVTPSKFKITDSWTSIALWGTFAINSFMMLACKFYDSIAI